MNTAFAAHARRREVRAGRGGWLAARAGSTRTTGLAVAALLSIAFAGVIIFYVTRAPRASSAGLDDQDAPAPPDIKDISKTVTPGSGFEVAGGKEQRVTFTDRNDPTRIAGQLGWDRLEPLEGKRYHLEQPRSMSFLKDGRIVYVRADRGRFVIPRQDQEPQSGTLSGNVEIRLFAPAPPGVRIDPERAEPILTARMDSVDFDTTTGEMRTASRVEGEGSFGRFAFTGMHAVTNQSEKRIELLEIDRGEMIVLRPNHLGPGGQRPSNAVVATAPANGSREIPAPAEKSAAIGAPPGPAPASTVTPPASATPSSQAPIDEVFYAALFSDDVRVVQGAKEISSDRLFSWARLVDGKLAPGATGEAVKSSGATRESGAARSSPSPPVLLVLSEPPSDSARDRPPAIPPLNLQESTPGQERDRAPLGTGNTSAPISESGVEPSPEALPSAQDGAPSTTPEQRGGGAVPPDRSDGDVTITWTGSLVMRAEKSRPAELAKDEVSFRFESDLPGGTRFAATDQNASGGATVVEYYATTRRVGLIGDETTPAVIRSENAGRLEASRVSVSVPTGVVDIASAGVLTQQKKPGEADASEAPRRVSWGESAQFLFDTRDGQMTGSLREAFLTGVVDARDGRGALNGGFLHATFIPSPRTSGQAVLRRIEVREGASAKDGRGGLLAAGELDLSFVPVRKGGAGIGESEPREFEARGGVHVEREGVTLDADKLRAGLASKSQGQSRKNDLDVTDVKADGLVRFTRRDGVTANADQLRADAVREIVELSGDHVSLSKGASSVSGTSMVLRGQDRSLEVFGEGVFEHNPGVPAPAAEGDADGPNPASDMGHVLATWKVGMAFSDATGILDAAGDVRATYSPDPLEQDRLAGERLHLELTPGAPSDGIASLDLGTKATKAGGEKRADDRRLLMASVTGSDLERADGKRASVESRAYRPNAELPDGRELESLLYLEGSMIVADNVAGTLHVPSEGMLLSFDKRNTPPKVEVVGEEPTTARGTARVRWTGDLNYEREAGIAAVRGGVRLDHAPIESRDKAELESEKLVVRFRDAEAMDSTGKRLIRGQFLGATATGAVWARSAGKELTSDQLEYDAASRTIVAIASEGNLAQMFDPKNPTPVTARRIFWDLAKDRVEIKDAGTITIPK